MRYRRIGLSAFVTFLATILSVDLGLPVFSRYCSHNSQVLAQSLEVRKAENRQGEGNALGNLGIVSNSLWASDDSTAYLMAEFYKNIQHNPDKAQALRQAMLTTMKKREYSNPKQWAAFTLIGEAE
jgi:hypothetical protein